MELPSKMGQISKKQDWPPSPQGEDSVAAALLRGSRSDRTAGWVPHLDLGWEQGWDWQGRVFLPLPGRTLREMVTDREAWRAAVHRVTKSRTQLSD